MTAEAAVRPPRPTAESDYAIERSRLWSTVTAALAEAAELTHPTAGRLNVDDLLAEAFDAAILNPAGVQTLLASGREHHSENTSADRLPSPTTVRLNVAGLVDCDAAPGNGPYVDALDQLEDHPVGDALDEAARQLHREWSQRYATYAARFTEAVHTAADRLGITRPVSVETNTDPDQPYDEPGNTGDPGWADGDLLAWQLWRAALDTHPITELYLAPELAADHRTQRTGT